MQTPVKELKEEVVVLFAGDSGDGIQLVGGQFTETMEMYGNDISTFPNYPADIRAPQGTVSGVSGFQIKVGSVEVFTPGDTYDALVVMNAAALKVNLENLKQGGIIIANESGFDDRSLRLAGYPDKENPLEDHSLDSYRVHKIAITKLTREALKDSGLSIKQIDRSKNMFVLGFIFWMYSRSLDNTIQFINEKFKDKPELAKANVDVLKAGYHYGDTSETFGTRYEVKPAPLKRGKYRNVNGNQAVALGLIAASKKANLDLFYASYPITPASDVLHELSKYKNFNVRTFQAEDEIAAACSALGASFAGAMGATATSGPGMALKSETLGLAVMLELPMVIINVQRGGPSTGLPTKTEQADLFQAIYGRSGEAPMPVLAASTPSDCFDTVYEASRIAMEHMTPVIVLTDGYVANGAEPWKFPASKELKAIKPPLVGSNKHTENGYLPYQRNEQMVRPWAVPGMKGFAHRVGGLEKQDLTGEVSYDPDNHQKMVEFRATKVEDISIPMQAINRGDEQSDVVVLGWGSTFGAIETAVRELNDEKKSVAHIHLRYLNPFPKNLGERLSKFKKVVIPEMNGGQLLQLIRSQYLIDAVGHSKMRGLPYTVEEIKKIINQEIKDYE
ncbi:MAG TPA: 2-oxoacid:acceptor oxidoreductase subunit alpha [Cyclobacteriaceae bacterium]